MSATQTQWFDNHCHLTTRMEPADAVAGAAGAGVTRLLTVGCTVEDSKEAIAIADAFPNVWATAGVHPHDAGGGWDGLEELLADPNVVAVGECGLDYHYDHSPRDAQQASFVAQIAMAHAHDVALVIHTREAWEDTFRILDSEGIPDRTVFHCFTGGPQEAEQALARGAYLSFSGIVTFPTAAELREAAKLCPLDRLLVETDAPFLAPVPHRGKPNRPAFVSVVGEAVAQVKEVSANALAEHTWRNGEVLYRL